MKFIFLLLSLFFFFAGFSYGLAGILGTTDAPGWYVLAFSGLGWVFMKLGETKTPKKEEIPPNTETIASAELSKSIKFQDGKHWQNEFATILRWNEPIRQNIVRALRSLRHSFDERENIVFIVYKDTDNFFVSEIRLGQKTLKSKYISLIATPNRFIFVEPSESVAFNCFYKDIVSVHSNRTPEAFLFTIQTKIKLKIIISFSVSIDNLTETRLDQFKKLLVDFLNVEVLQNLKAIEVHSESNNTKIESSENIDSRKNLLEAELALAKGDRKTAALIIDKVLKQDFVNHTAWLLLYQLLGNGKDFFIFQKEFASKYYPDKVYLLYRQ